MEKVEAAAVGGIIGLLYGVVLWASVDSLSQASFILYGNQYFIPVRVALFIGVLSLAIVLSYPLWVSRAQEAIELIANADYDELEGDEFE
jgi:uncharacterized protein YacL